MGLYVYIADELRKDARRMGVALDRVQAFADDVEKKQSANCFNHFPPPFLNKKKIWAFNNRLIAAQRRFGEHLCIVLLRLLVKGDEYFEFEKDPITVGSRYLARDVNDEVISAWLAERTRISPPVPPPLASPNESNFLWSQVVQQEAEDTLIFETSDWINSVKNAKVSDHLVNIPQALIAIIEGRKSDNITSLPSDDRLKILYRWSSDYTKLLLVAALFNISETSISEMNEKWDSLLTTDNLGIARVSARSYPALICYDADMWIQVQRDAGANLALSPEEAEILKSARSPGGSDSGFPLFIRV